MSRSQWIADTTIPTDSSTAWLTRYGWQIVAAIICTIVVIGIYKALPKWAFMTLAAIIAVIAMGVKLK